MRASTSGSREAGPMVATIFVRRWISAARYRALAPDHVLRERERLIQRRIARAVADPAAEPERVDAVDPRGFEGDLEGAGRGRLEARDHALLAAGDLPRDGDGLDRR